MKDVEQEGNSNTVGGEVMATITNSFNGITGRTLEREAARQRHKEEEAVTDSTHAGITARQGCDEMSGNVAALPDTPKHDAPERDAPERAVGVLHQANNGGFVSPSPARAAQPRNLVAQLNQKSAMKGKNPCKTQRNVTFPDATSLCDIREIKNEVVDDVPSAKADRRKRDNKNRCAYHHEKVEDKIASLKVHFNWHHEQAIEDFANLDIDIEEELRIALEKQGDDCRKVYSDEFLMKIYETFHLRAKERHNSFVWVDDDGNKMVHYKKKNHLAVDPENFPYVTKQQKTLLATSPACFKVFFDKWLEIAYTIGKGSGVEFYPKSCEHHAKQTMFYPFEVFHSIANTKKLKELVQKAQEQGQEEWRAANPDEAAQRDSEDTSVAKCSIKMIVAERQRRAEDVARLDTRADNFESELELTDSNVTHLDARADNFESELALTDSNVAHLATRADKQESGLAQTNSNVTGNSADIAQLVQAAQAQGQASAQFQNVMQSALVTERKLTKEGLAAERQVTKEGLAAERKSRKEGLAAERQMTKEGLAAERKSRQEGLAAERKSRKEDVTRLDKRADKQESDLAMESQNRKEDIAKLEKQILLLSTKKPARPSASTARKTTAKKRKTPAKSVGATPAKSARKSARKTSAKSVTKQNNTPATLVEIAPAQRAEPYWLPDKNRNCSKCEKNATGRCTLHPISTGSPNTRG